MNKLIIADSYKLSKSVKKPKRNHRLCKLKSDKHDQTKLLINEAPYKGVHGLPSLGQKGGRVIIAALFVSIHGPYFKAAHVEPWDASRDARAYAGPYPVVAHPPCERWGRYWSGGPSAKVRRKLGDDDGCFEAALRAVSKFGGVVEQPEGSHAFKVFDLGTPTRSGGWEQANDGIGWICCVEQGHYGHPARKATWLYVVTQTGAKPTDLVWGPSVGIRLDEGFHSKAERDAARARGQKPIKRLSKAECIRTPDAFARVLIDIARRSE